MQAKPGFNARPVRPTTTANRRIMQAAKARELKSIYPGWQTSGFAQPLTSLENSAGRKANTVELYRHLCTGLYNSQTSGRIGIADTYSYADF